MPPLLAAIPAISGAVSIGSTIAGALGGHNSQDASHGLNLSPATANENTGQAGMMNNYNQFSQMVGAGPGQQDVSNGVGATRDFASLLQQYSQNGAGPTQGDVDQGNNIAKNLFAPQQTALNQSFVDQGVQADRQAALMGRSGNDPILQAKLRTEQMRQSAMLGANQGAFAQQYAMQQPFQRLGFAQQRAGILSGLASQAMANRSALMGMGENIMNNERDFRLKTAGGYSNASQQTGGGLGGAITGGIAGLASGMNTYNSMSASGLFSPRGGAPAGSGGFSGPGQNDWAQAMGAPGSAPAAGDWSFGFKG